MPYGRPILQDWTRRTVTSQRSSNSDLDPSLMGDGSLV